MDAEDRALTTMSRTLQAWQRALGNSAAGGAVVETGALVGSVVPAAPSSSLLNSAAAPFATSLDPAALDALAGDYARAGITKWGVWVHERDETTGGALPSAGLVLDSEPTAMVLDLAELDTEARRPDEQIEVAPCDELGPLAQAAGSGYGFPPALITGGVPSLLDHTSGWVAWIDRAPAGCVLIVRHHHDAGVFMVATAPAFRRRGAARAAIAAALLDAREQHGCTTSTLQSSEMGRPLYEQMGYRALGAYRLWERRAD